MEIFSTLPTELKIGVALLLFMIVWAIIKKGIKLAMILAIIVLIVLGLYSMVAK